ncbi:MAG: IPT/TIG domain-containing protein [Planctomycetota bacterium]
MSRLICYSLAAAVLALTTGCGGSGGGGGGGGGTTSKVSGKVVAGPVSGALVRVYRVNTDRSLTFVGEGTTAADGTYTLDSNGDGPFVVIAGGGTYTDEATGATKSLGGLPAANSITSLDALPTGTLTAMLGSGSGSGSQTVSLNPLTSIAARRTIEASKTDPNALSAGSVSTAATDVAREFGISGDPRTLVPLDLTSAADASAVQASPTSPAAQLGALLAALSQQAKSLGLSDPMSLVEALAQDFSDGFLNGQASGAPISIAGGGTLSPSAGTKDLASALQSFLNDPTVNKSGTTPTSFQTLIDNVSSQDVTPPGINKTPSFALIANRSVALDAGLQTVTVTALTPGAGETQTITFTAATVASTGTGSITGLTASASGGTGTITFTPSAQGNVTIRVTAKDDGGTTNGAIDTYTQDFVVTITPATAAPPPPPPPPPTTPNLSFVLQPTNVVAGATMGNNVTVEVLDPVTALRVTTFNNNITISLGSNPGAATLSGVTSANAVNGLATFSNLSLNKTGTGYTIAAVSTAANTGASQAFNVLPGAATALSFSVQPPAVAAGAPLTPSVAVELLDALGNRATGSSASITIALGNNPSGALLSGTLTRATVSGLATFTGVSLDKPGSGFTLTANAGGFTQVISSAFNVSAGAATQVVITTQPSNAQAGVNITPAIVVQVQDAIGNVVSGSNTITLSLANNPGGSTLGGTLSLNAVAGVATFSAVNLNKTGTGYTLSASSAGLTAATSNAFNITPGAATQLVFTGQPLSAQPNTALNPPVLATFQDAQGNVVPIASNVTVSLANNPTGAILGGTTTQASVNGVATFNDLTLDRQGNGFTLQAGSAPVTTATSSAFNITTQQLVFNVQPTNGVAGANLTTFEVRIMDGAALVTTSTATVTLALQNNPGGSTLGGTTSVNAVAGIATFTTVTLNKVGAGYTLNATSAGSAAAVSNAFNITAGPPTQLAFQVQPTNVAAGSSITPAVAVQALDANGNLAAAPVTTITLALGANPGGSTLSGTTTLATTAGVASFSNLSLNKTGTGYTLSASAAGLTGATSGTFNVTPGAPATLVLQTQPSDAGAGAPITPAVTVAIYDANANTVTTATNQVSVTINANPGGATLSGTTTIVPAGGVATFSDLNLDKVGTGYSLGFSAAGLTSATTTTFNITPGAPTQLAVIAQPTSATAGTGLNIGVELRDAGGNRVTGATNTVSVVIQTNPGGATLGGQTAVAAVAGVATFSTTSLDKAAAGYVLRFTSPGLTNGLSGAIAINPAAPSALAVGAQPTNVVAGVAITAFSINAVDPFGNVSPLATNTVTLAIQANPGGATLAGVNSASTVAGVASFSAVSLNKTGTGYTLLATAPGLTQVVTGAFNVTPAAPAALVVKTQPSDVSAGAAIAPAFVIGIQDAFGNDATSATNTVAVVISANPGAATLGGTTNVAAVGGLATFSTVTLDKTGNGYTLSATSAGLTGTTTAAFNVTPGAPAALQIQVQPSNVVAGAPITSAVTVRILDGQGNFVPTATNAVTASITSNAPASTLGGTTTIAAVGGVATFSNLSLNKVGTGYTLGFATAGLTSATSVGFDVSPAAPAALAVGIQPGSSVAGANVPAFLINTVDAFGNVAPVSSINVSLAIQNNPGGATLAGVTSTATVTGSAVFNLVTLNKVGTGYTLLATAPGLTQVITGAFNVTPAAPAALVVKTQPANVPAGSAITPAVVIGVQDAFGNDVTTATNTIAMVISANPGGSVLGGTLSRAAAGGLATFNDLTLNVTSAGYTLAAISTGLSGTTTAAFSVTPAVPDHLEFLNTTGQLNQFAGAAIASTNSNVLVRVVDGLGNTATGASNSISLALVTNPSGAPLLGTTLTANAVNGVATFTDVRINVAATGYQLGATTAGLTSATSPTFDIYPQGPGQVVFTTQPASTTAGAPVTPAIQIQDTFGNLTAITTGTVTLSIQANPGNATLGGASVLPIVSGVATFNVNLDKAGNGYTLSVAAVQSGLFSFNNTSNAFNITAGGPDRIVFAQQPTNSTAATAISPAVVVLFQDSFGNVANTAAVVTMTLASNPGGASLSGTTSVAAVGGVATFSNLSLDKAGVGYTLQAVGTAAVTTNTVVSAAFNNVAGAAANLAISQQPAPDIPVVTPITTAVIVAVTDAGGNLVGTDNGRTINVAIGANPGASTLSGTAAQVTSGGLATFPGLSLDNPGTGYTLSFSSTGLVTTATNTFNASLRRLVFLTQPLNGTAVAPINSFVVQFQDTLGNALPASDTVTVALVTTGTLTGTTGVAAVAGSATFNGLQVTTTGTHQLSASAVKAQAQTSATFTISAGPPTQLAFTTQPGNTAAGGTITPAVVVQLRDALGNVATVNTQVFVSLGNPNGAVLSGTLTQLSGAGVATFNDLSVNLPNGGYTLLASTATIGSTASAPFGALPPAPTVTSITPTSAPMSGGAPPPGSGNVFVEIRGTNFFGPLSATIGGVEVGGVSIVNTTTLGGYLQSNAAVPGLADVAVVNSAGSGVLLNGFAWQSSWVPVHTGLAGGSMHALARVASSSTVLAFAQGSMGVYGTADGGASFSRMANAPQVTFVSYDPSNPTTIYGVVAVGSGSVWRSTDQGARWMKVGVVPATPVSGIYIDPQSPQVLYATTGDGQPGTGVYKSVDGGANWAAASTGLPADATVRTFAIDPSNSQVLYACHTTSQQGTPTTGQGLYKSTNGGASWTALGGGVAGVDNWIKIVIDPAAPATVYAATEGGVGLYKSTDAGATWSAANTGLPATPKVYALAVHPSNGTLYAGVDTGGIFKSTNGAASWTATNSGYTEGSNGVLDVPEPRGITTGPGNEVWVTTAGAGVFRSTDAGATWTQILNGLNGLLAVTNVLHDPVQPNVVYAATNGRGIFRSTDGTTWTTRNTGLPRLEIRGHRQVAVDPANGNILWYASAGGGIFRSTDSGATWANRATAPIPAGVDHNCVAAVGSVVVVGTSGNQLFRSSDDGATWTNITTGLPNQSPQVILIDRSNVGTFYVGYTRAGAGAGLWKSINGGTSWAQLTNGPLVGSANVVDLIQDPLATNTLYAQVGGVKPLVSNDAGATWAAMNTSQNAGFFASLTTSAANPNKLFTVQGGAVDRSSTGGATWEGHLFVGLPSAPASLSADNAAEDLVYAGFGPFNPFGVWRTNNGGLNLPSLVSGTPSTYVDPTADGFGIAMSITGSGFSSQTQVFVNGVPVTSLAITPTLLTFNTPNGLPAGIYNITIQTPNGTLTIAGGHAVGTGVTSISPSVGASSGRNPRNNAPVRVELTGLNLTAPVSVKIGGVSLTGVALVASDAIAANLPLPVGSSAFWLAPGSYDVEVTTGFGVQTLPGAFTVTAAYQTTHGTTTPMLGGGVWGRVVVDPGNSLVAYLINDGPVGKTIDGGVTWTLLESTRLLDLKSIAASASQPGTLYATTAQGQSYVSTNAGATWTARGSAGQNVVKLLVNPTNAQILFAGTGGESAGTGVWRSTDGGASWANVTSGTPYPASGCVKALAFDQSNANTIYASNSTPDAGPAGTGLYVSTDGGTTWAQLANTAGFTDIRDAVANGATLYVCGANDLGVQKSIDSGANWAAVNTGLRAPPFRSMNALAVSPLSASTLYVAEKGQGSQGVFKTTDGGATWNRMSTGLTDPSTGVLDGPHVETGGLAIGGPIGSGSGPDIVYAATAIGPFVSKDSAASWTYSVNGLQAVRISALQAQQGVPGGFFAATKSGIWYTSDGGQNWVRRNSGLPTTEFYADRQLSLDPGNGNTAYACFQGSGEPGGISYGVWKTTNAGVTWTQSTTANVGSLAGPADKDLDHIAHGPSGVVYASSDLGPILRTVNGGGSWTTLATAPVSTAATAAAFALRPDPVAQDTLYVVLFPFSGPRGVHKTTDGGASWTEVGTGANGLPNGIGAFDVFIHPGNTNVVLVLSSGGTLYRSADAGASWTAVSNLQGGTRLGYDGTTGFPGTLYVTSQAGVAKSTDGGVFWSPALANEGTTTKARYEGSGILLGSSGGVEIAVNSGKVLVAASSQGQTIQPGYAVSQSATEVLTVTSITGNNFNGAAGGTVTISGTGFHKYAGVVRINGVTVTATVTATSIVATVNPGQFTAGTYNLDFAHPNAPDGAFLLLPSSITVN